MIGRPLFGEVATQATNKKGLNRALFGFCKILPGTTRKLSLDTGQLRGIGILRSIA